MLSGAATVLAVTAVGVGTTIGAADARAVVGPRIAVSISGNTDWQVTFDKGDARSERCKLFVGNKVVPISTGGTATVSGVAVKAGRHPVVLRCGRQSSPTLWLYAPRGQINDIATWASNTTAGILGI